MWDQDVQIVGGQLVHGLQGVLDAAGQPPADDDGDKDCARQRGDDDGQVDQQPPHEGLDPQLQQPLQLCGRGFPARVDTALERGLRGRESGGRAALEHRVSALLHGRGGGGDLGGGPLQGAAGVPRRVVLHRRRQRPVGAVELAVHAIQRQGQRSPIGAGGRGFVLDRSGRRQQARQPQGRRVHGVVAVEIGIERQVGSVGHRHEQAQPGGQAILGPGAGEGAGSFSRIEQPVLLRARLEGFGRSARCGGGDCRPDALQVLDPGDLLLGEGDILPALTDEQPYQQRRRRQEQHRHQAHPGGQREPAVDELEQAQAHPRPNLAALRSTHGDPPGLPLVPQRLAPARPFSFPHRRRCTLLKQS